MSVTKNTIDLSQPLNLDSPINYDFCEYMNASALEAVMETFPVQVGGDYH